MIMLFGIWIVEEDRRGGKEKWLWPCMPK